MNSYKLLSSSYVAEDKKKYVKGDIVKSTLKLDELFVNKFEKIGKAQVEEVEEVKKPSSDNDEPEGENVTDKFDSAVEAGLEVHKVGNFYIVTDPTDKDIGALNDDNLTSKLKVNAFI